MDRTLSTLTCHDYDDRVAGGRQVNGEDSPMIERRAVSLPPIGNSDDVPVGSLRIALIDNYTLTRDCILRAMSELQPTILFFPFFCLEDFISAKEDTFDLAILYSHASYNHCLQEISAVHGTFGRTPLIILSDIEDSHQINLTRGALRAGANGFISTRTTGLSMTLSAIRFVHAGGTFAPLEMLLSDNAPAPVAEDKTASPYSLTARQRAVLAQLQQGKANKIIAHELGMSESTAKVHIRNIMRKLGATNRTQAAFNALRLCPDRFDSRPAL